MLEIDIRMLAAREVTGRYALIEAAVEAFSAHPNTRILSPGGFRFAIAGVIRSLQDLDIYAREDIWHLIDFMYRDDVHPLVQLRVHKLLIDPQQNGQRKMKAIRAVIGADPVVPMPG